MMKKLLIAMFALMLAVAPCAMAETGYTAPTDEMLDMLPVFDSIMRTVQEEASSYDSQNAEFVWSVLYRLGVNFGLDYADTSIDEETYDIVVPGALMRSFAAAAFPDLASLPPVSESVTYVEDADIYRLPGSDMGDTQTVVEGYLEQDGKLTVAISMKDYEGNVLDGMTFTVSPAQAEALFPYVVNSAE